jgi:hypothetical protein
MILLKSLWICLLLLILLLAIIDNDRFIWLELLLTLALVRYFFLKIQIVIDIYVFLFSGAWMGWQRILGKFLLQLKALTAFDIIWISRVPKWGVASNCLTFCSICNSSFFTRLNFESIENVVALLRLLHKSLHIALVVPFVCFCSCYLGQSCVAFI